MLCPKTIEKILQDYSCFAPVFLHTPLIVLSVMCTLTLCVCVCAHACDFVPLPAINTGGKDVPESIQRIEKLLNTSIEFHELDLLDKSGLEKLFQKVRKLQEFILLQHLRAHM